MFHSSFRLYLTANALIYCAFACLLFPEGITIGLIAILISMVFSAPTLLLLFLCFLLIHKYRPGIAASWLLVIATVLICVFVPLWIFLEGHDMWSAYQEFLPISAGAAFGALILQSVYLHKHFKLLHYEND